MAEKARHLQLAGVVKDVHAKLRTKFKNGEEFENLWTQHCQDTHLLTQYAGAMHELATDIWTANNTETRIDWCKTTCLEYFYHGGLQKLKEKEQRRAIFHNQKETNISVIDSEVADRHLTNEETTYLSPQVACEFPLAYTCSLNKCIVSTSHKDVFVHEKPEEVRSEAFFNANLEDECSGENHDKLGTKSISSDFPGGSGDTIIDEIEDLSLLHAERKKLHLKYGPAQYNQILLPFTEKICLLDVGSCYNPFEQYKEFISVAIDISPAVKSVYHCDFLHLDTTKPLQLASDTIDSIINCLKDPVEKLPENSFHVIVFSLLLEYFPSAYQRWICCEKAQKLLMFDGLLLIITPDSHHQNKNAPMMKSWKKAIESMGFQRCRYEKQQHLHCMAFRNIGKHNESYNSLIKTDAPSPNMLYIPQDFKEETTVFDESEVWLDSKSQDDNFSLEDGFSELPDIDEL